MAYMTKESGMSKRGSRAHNLQFRGQRFYERLRGHEMAFIAFAAANCVIYIAELNELNTLLYCQRFCLTL